jgi:hypothetical protein
MDAEPAQMVHVSGWIGGRTLIVDGFWQPLAASAESDGACRRFFLSSGRNPPFKPNITCRLWLGHGARH